MRNHHNKRIAIIIGGLYRAGAETQCVHAAIGLKRRGWEVSVISLLKPEAFKQELAENSISLISLDVRKSDSPLRLLLNLRKVLKIIKPSVILSFMYHSNILARLVRLLGVKARIVSSIRGEKFGEGEWNKRGIKVKLREIIFRLTNPFADVITTNSKYAAKKITDKKISPQEKTVVVPNGIELYDKDEQSIDTDAFRKELDLNNEFIWINVARLMPVKGQKYLLEALVKHLSSFPDSRLVIVGDGPERNTLHKLIKTSGIENKVFLLGERNDIPSLLSSSDAFVFSSLSEGLPNAVMEAHLAELPVVTTRCGGVEEIVTDGASGVVVASANSDELANAMNRLRSKSSDELKQMGQSGYKHIISSFEMKNVIKKWEAVLLGE